MSKIKSGSLSESVSESVTRSPIELFWTAKNHLIGVILPQIPLQLTQIIEDLRVLS